MSLRIDDSNEITIGTSMHNIEQTVEKVNIKKIDTPLDRLNFKI